MSEEPPPLGPPPAGDGLASLEEPGFLDELTDREADPTRRLRRLEMADLALARTEDPTRELPLEEGGPVEPESPVSSPRFGGRRTSPTRSRGHGLPETDWPEPPELPEPPVQFAPPEMTIPPRLPDLPAPPDGDAPPSENISESALRFAEHLGTPELPDLTPSDLPNGLRARLRETRSTSNLRSGGGSTVDREFGVVSQVVDMPLGVMHPTGGEGRDGSSWAQEGSLDAEPSVETEFITAVWSAGPPPGSLGLRASRARHEDAPPTSLPAAVAKEKPGEPEPPKPSIMGGESRDLIAGRYRVLERVGQGGMARIFRVQHTELGKDFALKIIHTALSEDVKVKEMFYREARLASSLDHPNIVLLTDFGVDENFGAFIVMEYLKGESLHARLRREGKLHQNVACEIALQVAEALHFIHGKNVVHCDIKSENVFLCEPPPEQRRRITVKLLDFGLSRQKIPSGRVSISEVGGTPAYMAPERINRMSPRPSMDIYSLGVLFYEMLTGTLPFGGTVEETLVAQLKEPPEPISRRLKEAPDDRLEELVMRALAKDPDERQKDMGALVYELRTVMDMLGIGRRRGGGKAAARAASAGRVRNCELLVADCPLPLFMTDVQGSLIVANLAFASFVNLTVEQTAGMPLGDTRLARLCPEILGDLGKTITGLKPTQRILSFPWRSSKQVSMMIWLIPEIVEKQLVGVIGVVHPFSTAPLPAK